MTALRVAGAVKSFGRVAALRGVELAVPGESMTAIVGPSGCGKTTLLRCVAGFERLDRGEIELAGRSVGHVPAHRRCVAVVPQEGALFPHLSVARNVGYGLDRAHRRSARVDEVLELVGLAGLGSRYPHQLSGGQQQRVAVARALAPRPSLVLLDEPFNALDAGLRAELRHDIREALRADGASAVLVTHDQDEALAVADQLAVMRDGVIVQAGTPAEVYRLPATPWVATFIGEAVLLPGTAEADGAVTALGRVPLAFSTNGSGRVTVLLRPEQVTIDKSGEGVPATVRGYDFHGHDALVSLVLSDGTEITARTPGTTDGLDPGAEVHLRVTGMARAWGEGHGPHGSAGA